jgi:hypothetical protein
VLTQDGGCNCLFILLCRRSRGQRPSDLVCCPVTHEASGANRDCQLLRRIRLPGPGTSVPQPAEKIVDPRPARPEGSSRSYSGTCWALPVTVARDGTRAPWTDSVSTPSCQSRFAAKFAPADLPGPVARLELGYGPATATQTRCVGKIVFRPPPRRPAAGLVA